MPKKRFQRNASSDDQKENMSVKSRKRKASSPLEEADRKHRNTRPWDHDTNIKGILQDMGVDFLSQTSTDSCESNSENTPIIIKDDDSSSSLHLSVPGAPRILLPRQQDNITCSEESDSCQESHFTPSLKSLHGSSKFIICKLPKKKKVDSDLYDYFSSLSDEIVLTIFSWLPKFVLAKCAIVCKKWSRLVLDESLWKRIDLSAKTLGPGVLGHVMNRGVWALRLAKTEIEGPLFTGPTSPIKAARLSKVQYLDLSMAGTTPDVLEEIFAICKDLRKVSLENLEVNDKVCSLIGENKDLSVLNMAMCRGITVNGLIPILSNCRQLESLHVGWTNLHHHSVVYLCLCAPPSLRRLNISGCRENIKDDEVLQLCKTCPNLVDLDLSDSTCLTSNSILHIKRYLRQLDEISLSRCYHISPAFIPELNTLPFLSAVNVFGMLRDEPLDMMRGDMPTIEINESYFSEIARPTTGHRRTSIWGIRVRDNAV